MRTDPAPAAARIAVDPITVEVIGNALASIVEEMGETLVRAAYSTNIKERRDSSTCLFDARGRTLCQAMHIPMHLGSLIGVIEHVVARHAIADLRPGDVFVGNDAYTGGGTHLPDIVLAEPIFFEGKLVAWATNTAHHADFVDRKHDHIFQEGLRIPPVRLYSEGVLQQDIMDMILLNMQVPRERLNDFRAQMAANRQGVLRFQSLCARYGTPLLLSACDALLDYTERLARAGISTLPEGSYSFRDRFDCDELGNEVEFAVRVDIKGGEIFLDFAAPPQVRAGINLVRTGLLACVYYAVKTLIGADIPANAGLYRPIHVASHPGTMLECSPPAAVDARIQTAQRVVDLILGALAPALPERIAAAGNGACTRAIFTGTDPRSGEFYVYLETLGGGFGARATKDGLDGVHVHMSNTSNLPVESLEQEYPLVVDCYELVQDSGGAGAHRGGMAIRRRLRPDGHACRTHVLGSRRQSSPWGLFGGGDGARLAIRYDPRADAPARGAGMLRPGEWLEVVTPGAGGYGDPVTRARTDVARDLAEERISPDAARALYRLEG